MRTVTIEKRRVLVSNGAVSMWLPEDEVHERTSGGIGLRKDWQVVLDSDNKPVTELVAAQVIHFVDLRLKGSSAVITTFKLNEAREKLATGLWELAPGEVIPDYSAFKS